MNFTYYGADLSKTIKSYKKNGYSYHIEYLDGSTSDYTCYNEEEDTKIKELMLKQAMERQKKIKENYLENSRDINKVITIVSAIGTIYFVNDSKTILALLSATVLLPTVTLWKERSKTLKELRKYRMFLEMAGDLKDKDQTELLKTVEFDTFYQRPLSIESLDEFTYGDVKLIYKKFNTRRNIQKSK